MLSRQTFDQIKAKRAAEAQRKQCQRIRAACPNDQRIKKSLVNTVYGLLHIFFVGMILVFFVPTRGRDEDCRSVLSHWIVVQIVLYILFAIKHFVQAYVFRSCVDPLWTNYYVQVVTMPTIYLFQVAWALYGFTLYASRDNMKSICRSQEALDGVDDLLAVTRGAALVANYYLIIVLVVIVPGSLYYTY